MFCSGHLPYRSSAWQWDNARPMLTGLIAATRRFSIWMTGFLFGSIWHCRGTNSGFLSGPPSPRDTLLLPTGPWTHSPGFAPSVGTGAELGQRAWSQCTCMSLLLCWPWLHPSLCRFHLCEIQIVPYGIPVYC